jgi:hypothetical protein
MVGTSAVRCYAGNRFDFSQTRILEEITAQYRQNGGNNPPADMRIVPEYTPVPEVIPAGYFKRASLVQPTVG